MLSVFLLVLTATQGSRGEVTRDVAIASMIKDVGRTLDCFSSLHHENIGALKELQSLPDIVSQLKDKIIQQNEKFGVTKSDAALQRADLLGQENEEHKTLLANKDQKIQELEWRLNVSDQTAQRLDHRVQELHFTVEELIVANEALKNKLADKDNQAQAQNVTTNETQACMEPNLQEIKQMAQAQNVTTNETQACTEPNLQEIKQMVQTFETNDDWSELKSRLESILDDRSEVYNDLQSDDISANSPMWGIGRYNKTRLAHLLLCAGLPVDTADSIGETMLNGAAGEGLSQLVQMLLRHGADVNRKGYLGWTALARAAVWGHLEVMKILLQAGASTTITDDSGRTPLNLARAEGHTEIVHYLENLIR